MNRDCFDLHQKNYYCFKDIMAISLKCLCIKIGLDQLIVKKEVGVYSFAYLLKYKLTSLKGFFNKHK